MHSTNIYGHLLCVRHYLNTRGVAINASVAQLLNVDL